jgi:hypothetical protein
LASPYTPNSSNAEGHKSSLWTKKTSLSPVRFSNALDRLGSSTPAVRSEPFTTSLHDKLDALLERVNDMQQLLRQHFVQKALNSDDFEFDDLHMPLDSDLDVTALETSLQDKTTRVKLVRNFYL